MTKTTIIGTLSDSILYDDLPNEILFGDQLRLTPLPEWMKADGAVQELNKWQRDRIQRHTSHIFIMHHERSDGSDTQDDKDVMKTAFLSCWLAKPTALCVQEYLTYEDPGTGRYLKEYVDGELLAPLYKYQNSRFRIPDAEIAVQLFAVLLVIPRESALWQSIKVLWASLREYTWEFRFLLLWTSLESLFGPESPGETTFRISQRIAFFLKNGRSRTKHLNDFVKDSYSWRSKVVHGMRLGTVGGSESKKMMVITEAVLRFSLLRILQDKAMLEVFGKKGKGREKYLNQLPFAHNQAMQPTGKAGGSLLRWAKNED